MRIRTALVALTVLPASMLSVAAVDTTSCRVIDDAATQDAADDVLACEASVYLGCESAHGGKVHVPSSLGTGVKFVDEAPTESIQAGAGCGQVEVAQAIGSATTSIYDLNATGFIEGNVDSVTVELHQIYAGSLRAGGDVTLDVRLVVGGQSPTGFGVNGGTTGDIASPVNFSLEVPLEVSETGLSESMTFTITDLYEMFPELSVAGVGDENYQTLDLTVAVDEVDWVGAFVWGTTEVPAGLTINGEERGLVVSAFDL